MRNTVVIVGAGFGGMVLAANLLRRGPPGAADGEDFLPRELYGDYLQEGLRQAEAEAEADLGGLRDSGAGQPAPGGEAKVLTVARRSLGGDRGHRTARSRRTACRAFGHDSRLIPSSRRFNSSRVLYMEMPVRNRPPR